MTTDAMVIRRRVVESARWAVSHKDHFTYAEVRPIPLDGITLGRGLLDSILPVTTDCSGFVTMCAKAAGAADPNGLKYDGQGFTGDLLSNLTLIERHHTWRGDLVVFGPGNGDHVAVLLEGGSHDEDPPCASHGEAGDPSIYALSALINFFAKKPPVRYLQLMPNE